MNNNPRDKIDITITDINGSKYYTFKKIIKKYLFYSLIGIIGIFILLGVSIFVLNNKVEQYKGFKNINLDLLKNIEGKEKVIEEKTIELNSINAKMALIEKVMNKEKPKTELDEESKVDNLILSKAEKEMFYNVIPNGNPIDPFTIYTSKFGSRIHPVLNKRIDHWGLDFRAKVGTKIIAPADGIIKFAGKKGTFGNLIIISHAYGIETYYAHLSKFEVKVGDLVDKGEIIALSGNTGRTSGPHLHYEIHYLGKKLDPMNFATWDLKNYDTIFKKELSIEWQSLVNHIKKQRQIQIPKQQLSQKEQELKEILR